MAGSPVSNDALPTHWDVAIVGAGPAGLMAAARSAQRGRRTILLDKNGEPGVKILISGGARCNLTHATDARGIVAAFGPPGRFLHSALAALGPQQVVDLFEAEGVPTKIELGGKVFPVSDRAADVRNALLRRVERAGCTLALGEPIVEITVSSDRPSGEQERCHDDGGHAPNFRLVTSAGALETEKLVLATGGQSYPACGTTGDGYRFAASLGHRIVPPHPALVPVTSHAPWVLALQGITLPDVLVRVVARPEENVGAAVEPPLPSSRANVGAAVELPTPSPSSKGQQCNCKPNSGSSLATSRGALLFAHFGVTGPAVLDVSHAVSAAAEPNSLVLRCDLLPDVKEDELEARLADAAAADGKRRAAALLQPWLPRRVAETLLELIGAPVDRTAAEFSKAERRRLARIVKQLDIPASGTMGFRKAEVTAGGVCLDEVDSRTMQSRLVPNLYFAGELLDLHGPVGGYNFQAAFSTGFLAGDSV
ncbi:MAG: NAD(P)/FAD-dependent oxidoreductase [Planctomycetaceae bacterium]|nr:NAD(P)/FAD-dependent oxidoreductase [Planctomycetaceae bacterium]